MTISRMEIWVYALTISKYMKRKNTDTKIIGLIIHLQVIEFLY